MSSWEVRFSNSRRTPYFYNPSTGESTWDVPAGLSEADVKNLPGADRYLSGPDSGGGANGSGPTKVRASHILAKHTGSRRPSSWKQAQITRSPDEAGQIISKHIETLKALPADQLPRKFAEIASTESDCSSAQKGGDLGLFGRGQMQAAFEQATFALKVGEMSDIINTDSGTHVILRTA